LSGVPRLSEIETESGFIAPEWAARRQATEIAL
jgi:hypothetical protein